MAQAVLSRMISSIDLTSRASSMTCWPSRTVMPSASRAAIIGGSPMSSPRGMSATPSALRMRGDLARGGPEQPGVGGDRAAQPDHPGVDVVLEQPRAVEPVVLGGRPEVPDVRLAAARLERVAGHLVARPLADVGARQVPDVVEVEGQDGARGRRPSRAARARPKRYWRRRSTFQRSSQSTFIDPGEAIGLMHRGTTPIRSPGWGCDRGRHLGVVHPCYTRTSAVQVARSTTRMPRVRCPTNTERGRRSRGPRPARGFARARVCDDGRPPASGPDRAGHQPALDGPPPGRLAEPHLAGRDRAGPSPRSTPCTPWPTSSASRSTSCCSWTRRRSPPADGRGAAAEPLEERLPHEPGAASRRAGHDPPRIGRGLGAPDDRVAAQRRLPVRDLRGRRRVEPGGRLPAPHRAWSGATSCRGTLRVNIGFDEYVLGPGRRDHLRLGGAASAVQRRRASRSTRSGSSWAAGAPSPRADRGPTSPGRRCLARRPSCNIA